MLAVSCKDYYLPTRVSLSPTTSAWQVRRKANDEYTVSPALTYTIAIDHEGAQYLGLPDGGRIGICFDESGVKVTARTRRIYGPKFSDVLASFLDRGRNVPSDCDLKFSAKRKAFGLFDSRNEVVAISETFS